jgi:uncharacterized protein (DUF885 family)
MLVLFLTEIHPARNPRDVENYLARLHAFPAYARQQIANMREGLRTGFTEPRVTLEAGLAKTYAWIEKQVAAKLAASGAEGKRRKR